MKRSGTKKALLLLMAAGTMLLLFACGGGGSGGGGEVIPTAYTGSTDQAVVTSSNAQPLALDAYNGGSEVSNLPIPLAAGSSTVSPPDIRSLIGIFDKVAKSLPLSNAVTPLVITDISGTGLCSGSYVGQVNDYDGVTTISGWITFTNFSDDCLAGATLDGPITFSGNISVNGVVTMTLNFDGTTVDGTTALYGSFTTIVNSLTNDGSIIMRVVFENLSTTETLYVSYNIVLTNGPDVAPADSVPDYQDISVTGRFYSHNEGYLDITTTAPLRTLAGDTDSSSGVLHFAGANGTYINYTITGLGTYTIDWYDGVNYGSVTGP